MVEIENWLPVAIRNRTQLPKSYRLPSEASIRASCRRDFPNKTALPYRRSLGRHRICTATDETQMKHGFLTGDNEANSGSNRPSIVSPLPSFPPVKNLFRVMFRSLHPAAK